MIDELLIADFGLMNEPFAKFASRWDLLPGRVVIPGKPMAGQVQIRILQKARMLNTHWRDDAGRCFNSL